MKNNGNQKRNYWEKIVVIYLEIRIYEYTDKKIQCATNFNEIKNR